MSSRDRFVPAVAGLAVLLVGIVIVALLRGAEQDGTHALEDAKQAQVQTTAQSFDARVVSTFQSLSGLGSRPWELTLRSKADQAVLDTFTIDPDAESGSFLVDKQDRIVSGTLLRPGKLGSTYDAPGWEQAKTKLASAPAVMLPVADSGVTSELPSYAFAVAIRDPKDPSSVRGAFVFEGALSKDSAFNQEIQGLADTSASTESWRFVDDSGRVVATSTATGLGEKVPASLVGLAPGKHEIGDDLVFSADVPSVGWRVMFTQQKDEFVGPLAGPLQTVGLILIVVLLATGLLLTVVLARRLRQEREERRRLQELTRSQEEFISVVSHELRTPVSGVLGFLQTSLDHWDGMDDGERRNAVSRAFLNARRLQAMTRDVLDTESLESGRFGYVMGPVDLADEVRTAADAFGPSGVEISVPVDAVPVEGDADRLQQVLTNLLDNARRSAPADTPVRVDLGLDGDLARLTVEDSGSGIDPDQLERIFDKFVRGREGAVSGTGLGLYIARQIVEAHHGRIWAESRPGQTRFVVELPLSRVAAPRLATP
ncbi:sensor histidine kinase [Nocardioides marmoribigeumensis]|uniref:histidine kinase n=1 Tax=Nocardioides marmoribigeumensis TaxID=433649 RepID=A0ABU2BVL3_9ACTN|nr:HAMP domain-containing sensor histidine kinase [Nocardioides marmoribigeumensis]MDR7362673.1 signal transduction histidine kinase [Nocardioides marmoribigeumensis]